MLSKILDPILNLFRYHKKKMAILFGLYVFFLYLLFPFNDLGDMVSSKISEATQGQVYVDFDNITLSLIPSPGLALSKVTIETPFSPALTAKSLSVAPSVLGLLSFKPGVNVHASGFLGGDVDLSAGTGDKTQTTPSHRKQKVSIDMSDVNLGSLAKLASSPMRFDGNVTGTIDSQIDADFMEQPTADIDIKSEKTVIPEGNITTPFGPVGLPKLNMGEIVVQGRADKGSLELSRLVAGKPGGDLFASATGRVDVRFSKLGNMITPQVGAYDLNVKLQVGDVVKQKLGSFLGILQNYQTSPNSYSFRVSAPNSFAPPNITRSN